MPYPFEIKPDLAEHLKKLRKKNSQLYERVHKKLAEIIENPEHYKPLRYNMKNLRRAHIEKSFVLVFTFSNNLVEFLELEHHDKIYKR